MQNKTKRAVAIGAAIAAIFAAVVLCIVVPSLTMKDEPLPPDALQLVGHRGFSAAAPENTLASFRLAAENGFWGAECDIQQTADGVWVIMHDLDVKRMTDGKGKVNELTFAQIRSLHIDSGRKVRSFPDEKVPTLEEYLDLLKNYDTRPVIEIKSAPVEAMDDLAAFLLTREEKESFVLISFDRADLARIKTLMPQNPAWLLTEAATQDDIDFCLQNGIDGLDFRKKTKPDIARAAAEAGLKTIVWAVDDWSKAKAFYDLGVTAITTNALTPDAF